MSEIEDCARDLYTLTRLPDDPDIRERIDQRIQQYLARAKWHASVGAEKDDLATVFEAIASVAPGNHLTAYVLHTLRVRKSKDDGEKRT
jgi:hypothetical protein